MEEERERKRREQEGEKRDRERMGLREGEMWRLDGPLRSAGQQRVEELLDERGRVSSEGSGKSVHVPLVVSLSFSPDHAVLSTPHPTLAKSTIHNPPLIRSSKHFRKSQTRSRSI